MKEPPVSFQVRFYQVSAPSASRRPVGAAGRRDGAQGTGLPGPRACARSHSESPHPLLRQVPLQVLAVETAARPGASGGLAHEDAGAAQAVEALRIRTNTASQHFL